MEEKKKRLTLDLDAPVQRRLKAVAALKGVSMRQYCQTAIEKQLSQEESDGGSMRTRKHVTVDDLRALHKRLYGDKVFPGNSVDIIREEREKRDEQLWNIIKRPLS